MWRKVSEYFGSMTIRANHVSGSTLVSPQATETYKFAAGSVYRTSGKRILDVTLVALAALFVVPVMVVLAALVALDGHNPFYSQDRVGRGGRTFRLWKLRSMVPNADEKLEDHLAADAAARLEWDTTQKLKHDPRVTPIGRILRKSSIDEVPQLINVLFGDMSLVGPRPIMDAQREMYPGKAYYRLRPGITGSWQVSDRNECSFSARAQYDELYEREVTFSKDVSILVRTVAVVLRCTGY